MKQKTLFCSIALNVFLVPASCWLVLSPGIHSRHITLAPSPVPASVLASEKSLPEARTPAPAPAPFSWTQVESEDYPTYIANLRNIGCPEQTIQQIVTGEVAALYEDKLHDIQKSMNRPLTKLEVQQIQKEQQAAAANIFTSAADSAPLDSSSAPAAVKRAMMPLVFTAIQNNASPSPAAANAPGNSPPAGQTSQNSTGAGTTLGQGKPGGAATPEQLAALDQIRDNFINDIGGANQDPNDPAYASRWVSAQHLADERMRAYMGVPYFNWYQNEAARQEYEASKQ